MRLGAAALPSPRAVKPPVPDDAGRNSSRESREAAGGGDGHEGIEGEAGWWPLLGYGRGEGQEYRNGIARRGGLRSLQFAY